MDRAYKKNLFMYRHNFQSGGSIPVGVLPEHIMKDWITARENEVAFEDEQLPEAVICRENSQDKLNNFAYMQEIAESILQNEFDFLKKLGVVVFHLIRMGDYYEVYHKAGNKNLLLELERINLSIHTMFKAELFGNSAVTIVEKNSGAAWTYGAEHWHHALTNYALYAVELHEPSGGMPHKMQVNLYVMRAEGLTPKLKATIEYIASSNYTMKYSPKVPLSTIKEEIRRKHITNGTATIILNHFRIWLDADKYAYDCMGLTLREAHGKNISVLSPDIAELVALAEKGQKVQIHPVLLNGHSFYVDCETIYDSKKNTHKVIGFAIILRKASTVRKIANTLAGNNARFTFDSLIGQNPEFLKMKRFAMMAAESKSNVLICGESGTGKELIAQSIHNASYGKDGPFVAINCSALPKELIGSELFGYAEGAFTGAKKGGNIGKFEQANHGTIFLDEIAEMPLDMQSILLRVIEERVVTRLGSNQVQPIDVRIIAATNRDLQKCIIEGTFRMDLYYRLNVIRIDTVALRNHIDDLPLLLDFYVKSMNQMLDKNIQGFSKQAVDCLMKYSWPGNTRELRNVVEQCINRETAEEVRYETLPVEIRKQKTEETPTVFTGSKEEAANYASYEEAELEQIKSLMFKYKGNKSKVAEELGMNRAKLYNKLKKIQSW